MKNRKNLSFLIVIPFLAMMLSGCEQMIYNAVEGNTNNNNGDGNGQGEHVHVPGEPQKEGNHRATCTEDGEYYERTYCTECGGLLEEHWFREEALGHDYQLISQTPASYDEDGLSVYECSRCGDHKEVTEYAYYDSDSLIFYELDYSDDLYVKAKDTNISGVITIPSHHEGKPVTIIGNEAFKDCDKITTVVIPETVQIISSLAFQNSSIEYINIPKNITSMERAFKDAKSLTTVTLEQGVESISNAFIDCTALKNINIPSSIKYANSAFEGCTALESITLPSTLERIDESMFNSCTGLKTIDLKNVKQLGYGCFNRCSSLTSITIPSTVTRIANNVFAECSNLKTVNFKTNNLESLGGKAFYYCTSLTNVTLPTEGLRIIGFSAFEHCTSLESIVLPNTVEEMYTGAFRECINLVSINIPKQLKIAKGQIFDGCESLQLKEYNNALYIGYEGNDYVVLVKGKNFNITTCSINDSCVFVLDSAFSGMNKLESITIGKNVEYLGEGAFINCTSLTDVTFGGNKITELNNGTFYGCSALETIVIPNGVTKLCQNVFSLCDVLVNVTIPSSVKTIEAAAFYYCKALEHLTISTNVTFIHGDIFGGCDNIDLIVDGGAKYLVNGPEGSTFTALIEGTEDDISELTIRDDCYLVAADAFYYYKNLTTVNISRSVRYINEYAFKGLTTINYAGTKDEWKLVTRGSHWYGSQASITIHCSNGDVTETLN